MQKIYEQHSAAFKNVSAYVILKDGERVATIAFKFPKDGAGRLYTYVHWLGIEMVRGYANGYGYDKRSAAIENAMQNKGFSTYDKHEIGENSSLRYRFYAALVTIGGNNWDRALHDSGFTVLQAV